MWLLIAIFVHCAFQIVHSADKLNSLNILYEALPMIIFVKKGVNHAVDLFVHFQTSTVQVQLPDYDLFTTF